MSSVSLRWCRANWCQTWSFSSDRPHLPSLLKHPSLKQSVWYDDRGASNGLTTHWESVQLIFLHRQSLNKQSQQDRDEGAIFCCETKGSRGRRDRRNSRVRLSGRTLPLRVCVIPIRLHYTLISRRATQPVRTGQRSTARLWTRHTCHLR